LTNCRPPRLQRRRRHGGTGKPDARSSGHWRRSGAGCRGNHPVDRGHDRSRGTATPPVVRRWLPVCHVSDTHDRGGRGWPKAPFENGV